MVSANGKRVAVPAEDKHMQVGPAQGNATVEGQRSAVDVMRAVGLHKVREPTRTANPCHSRDFLMPELAFFDELEIEGEHGEIAAARTPGGMIRGYFFFGQPFAFFRGWHGWRVHTRDVAAARGDIGGGVAHSNTGNRSRSDRPVTAVSG